MITVKDEASLTQILEQYHQRDPTIKLVEIAGRKLSFETKISGFSVVIAVFKALFHGNLKEAKLCFIKGVKLL